MRTSLSIRHVAGDADALRDGLSGLLVDAVAGGASVGFLAPLSPAKAATYWQGVFAALACAAGRRAVYSHRRPESTSPERISWWAQALTSRCRWEPHARQEQAAPLGRR